MTNPFPPEADRPWTSSEGLDDLTLFADWDSVASMIEGLRIYGFQHGAIPTWNYLFCGGRPELSVPFSWAWTWPSAFAYGLPPNHAIMAAWVVLSLVGIVSTWLLLRSWTGSSLGAAVGAGLYVFNGEFATAFNRGHVTWAFYYLVPLLMLLFESSFRRLQRSESAFVPLLLLTLTSFMLLSGGLPQALIHLYPAFPLFVVLRIGWAARDASWRLALRAAAPALTAHLLGWWLAAYKLWPVIRWQADHPRGGTYNETNPLGTVLWDTVAWDVGFDRGPGGYIGPGAWLLAAVALVLVAWRRSPASGAAVGPSGEDRRLRRVVVLGLLLVVAGVALSLGRGHPFSPAGLLRYLPVLSGVRGALRFQTLTLLGLSVLAASGVSLLLSARRRVAVGGAMAWLLALLALAPVLVHAGAMVWNLPARPSHRIASEYPLPESPVPPEMVVTRFKGWYRNFLGWPAHTVALLRRGYWIANCRTDLALPHLYLRVEPRDGQTDSGAGWSVERPGSTVPLSSPPPVGLERLTRDGVVLRYPPGLRGEVVLHLPVLDGFGFNVPVRPHDRGRVRFDAEDLPEGRLEIRARYPGPRAGAVASGLGLVAAAGFFTAVFRKRRPARPRLYNPRPRRA